MEALDCKTVQREITGGQLSEPARAHVESCAGCRAFAAVGMAATMAAPAGAAPAATPAAIAYEGRYQLGDEIARGGMGRIVAAYDAHLKRHVAIKEVLGSNNELLVRFEREALITARLQHPAIMPIYEAGKKPSGEPFYVMRLVRGRSLELAIRERKTFEERLELLTHMAAATDAMAYAHSQRVIHRDLKPGNVLVGEFGETVVIDWGLAKDLDERNAPEQAVGPYRRNAPGETVAGAIMGTPVYMPPEQARGEAVDMRADVYALGAMLHHVLAGEPPFGGRDAEEVLRKVISEAPRPLPPEIPADLRAIVIRAMEPRAAGRYPTAREMAEDLRHCLAGRLVGAHRYTAKQLASRWLRVPWLPIALIAALVLTGVLGAAWIASERQTVRAGENERVKLWRENAQLRKRCP